MTGRKTTYSDFTAAIATALFLVFLLSETCTSRYYQILTSACSVVVLGGILNSFSRF